MGASRPLAPPFPNFPSRELELSLPPALKQSSFFSPTPSQRKPAFLLSSHPQIPSTTRLMPLVHPLLRRSISLSRSGCLCPGPRPSGRSTGPGICKFGLLELASLISGLVRGEGRRLFARHLFRSPSSLLTSRNGPNQLCRESRHWSCLPYCIFRALQIPRTACDRYVEFPSLRSRPVVSSFSVSPSVSPRPRTHPLSFFSTFLYGVWRLVSFHRRSPRS